MITFIAFVLTMVGSINWLLIGFLQYDFIAGFFGFQASIFSRIFYILFGLSSVYLGIRVIVNKGTFKVFERKKKKEKKEKKEQPRPAYAQAQPQQIENPAYAQAQDNFQKEDKLAQDNLFDEHINSFD